MNSAALLGQPRLSVITRDADSELARIQDLIEHKALVTGRADLEVLLGALLQAEAEPDPDAPEPRPHRTLDLIGHSTADKGLLALGDWVIDGTRPSVLAFFRELADLEVLPRLKVAAVRLLGCQTAESREARATICKLAEILGVDVLGTRQLLYTAHYDERGFRGDAEHVLLSSHELRGELTEVGPAGQLARYPRLLDVDALPASPLADRPPAWPLRLAGAEAARELLQLVRRTAGAAMPGLLAQPSCEIALPSAYPGWYHAMQVLLDGELVRVYPDGEHRPGVVYPVDDPRALRCVIAQLPSVTAAARRA
jgi:hypothetical protein